MFVRSSKPFSEVARFYDILMKGITYRDWITYTVDLFKRFGHSPKTILDMACGTGSASIELARRGYRVTGMDLSSQMLEIFESKRGSKSIPVFQADMRNFSLEHPVDAVTCYFDSMNYLMEERDLKNCFKSVYKSLRKKGLFVFDMNTIYGLEKVWGTNTLIREIENVYSVWKSIYNANKHVSTLYLTLFIYDDEKKLYRRVEEKHQERAYALDEIRTYLQEAGFGAVEIFAHMTTQTFMDISSRVMIVAEKKEV